MGLEAGKSGGRGLDYCDEVQLAWLCADSGTPVSTQTITRGVGETQNRDTQMYSVTADPQVSLPVFWLYLTRAVLE